MNATRTWRLIAAFVLAVPLHGLAQEDAAGKPAPSNVRAIDAKTSYEGAFADPKSANGKLDLLWIGCGTGDRAHASATSLHQTLDAAGVRHAWFEGPGSHEWQV